MLRVRVIKNLMEFLFDFMSCTRFCWKWNSFSIYEENGLALTRSENRDTVLNEKNWQTSSGDTTKPAVLYYLFFFVEFFDSPFSV